MEQYFQYGDKETDYLKARDKRLAEVIAKVGKVKRPVIPDLFSALVHSISGQQISTKAHQTVWRNIVKTLGVVSPERLLTHPLEQLQACGLSFKKAASIRSAAEKIASGEFNIQALRSMSDSEVREQLTKLDGVGVWTAEMLMLHSLQRSDILSFDDFAVRKGLRMLHGLRHITRALFEKYRRLYSPYGSVASIYLWAVSGGAVEGLQDLSPKDRREKKGKTISVRCKSGVCVSAMAPDEFGNGGENLEIDYDFFSTPFGNVLAASTATGICSVEFVDDSRDALQRLQNRFPNARFYPERTGALQKALSAFVRSQSTSTERIRLHLKGTPFRLKVWEALLEIPVGETSTYGGIAARMASPRAYRAVGSAVAENPVALLIPCHRIVPATGGNGNYRWGKERKEAILRWEASHVGKR